jgi:hypothetical protein
VSHLKLHPPEAPRATGQRRLTGCGIALGTSLLALLPSTGSSQPAGCDSYEQYAHWVEAAGTPFAVGEVAVRGGLSYLIDPYEGLIVMRTEDPAAPGRIRDPERHTETRGPGSPPVPRDPARWPMRR